MQIYRLFLPAVLLCGLTVAAPVDRIRTIDHRQTTALSNHIHPAAIPANDRGLVDPSMPMDHMMLMIKPSATQQAGLDRLLADQQNISSPSFHQWLTPEEFGNRFGLSAADGLVHSDFFTAPLSQKLTRLPKNK